MLPRILWYIASLTMISVSRWKKLDEESFPAIAILTIGMLIVETLFFVQEKAQVRLFMASKVIKLQEKQLLDVLDSVPDNVLVCSNEQDKDIRPQPLYNNRQMREFFGGSLVSTRANKKKRSFSMDADIKSRVRR